MTETAPRAGRGRRSSGPAAAGSGGSCCRRGRPSSRPASPRRRRSSGAWRPGCRGGCGRAGRAGRRRASSWRRCSRCATRAMALGALKSLTICRKRQQPVSPTLANSSIYPTTCARPKAALLSCRLNWGLGEVNIRDRRFFSIATKRIRLSAASGSLCERQRSGTTCSLPRSSTGCNCCIEAAFDPSRRILPSDLWGHITGNRARSAWRCRMQDIVLPTVLVCTIPHPLSRTSSAHAQPQR